MRHFLEQAMLTVRITHPVDEHEQCGPQHYGQSKAHEHVHTDDVEDGKQYQKQNKSDREVNDVLCLEPLELNGLVDALVDRVDTRRHHTPKND